MIGESEPMMHIREMISKVAPTPARVLIIGPNGSGKELVARSLHAESDRSAAPYIEVNCAAIPSELIESELSDTKRVRLHRPLSSIRANSNRPTEGLSFSTR